MTHPCTALSPHPPAAWSPGRKAADPPSDARCNRRRPVAHMHAHCSYTSNVSWKRPQVVTAVATDTNLFKELTNKWTFIPGPSQNGRPTTYVDIYVGFSADAPPRPGAAACSD